MGFRAVSQLLALMIVLAVAIAIAVAAASWIISTYQAYGAGGYEAISIIPPTNVTLYVVGGNVTSAKLYLTMTNKGSVEAAVYKVELLSSDGKEIIQSISKDELMQQLQKIGKSAPVLPVGARVTWPLDLDPVKLSRYVGAAISGVPVEAHFMVKVYTERGNVYPGIAVLTVVGS